MTKMEEHPQPKKLNAYKHTRKVKKKTKKLHTAKYTTMKKNASSQTHEPGKKKKKCTLLHKQSKAKEKN